MVDPEATYRRQTPGSRALYDSAVAVMPGGTTRTTTYFDPYPLYITRGEGCRIWDADGTERLDMLGNYTAMILGHAHPKVVEAIRKQAAQGTGFAAANPVEVKLATLLCERVPASTWSGSATPVPRRPCSPCGWRGRLPADRRSHGLKAGTTGLMTTQR